MAVHDPEDAPWWYIYGRDKAREFVQRVASRIGLQNVSLNPAKTLDVSAPALVVNGVLTALKTQETPYFKARRDYAIEPQYAVSFNRGDYELYSSKYQNLPIYFWVNWQELQKFGIAVQPMFGVYEAAFPEIAKEIETGAARLHEYVNRVGDTRNETHSYGLDVRKFRAIVEFDPTKQSR